MPSTDELSARHTRRRGPHRRPSAVLVGAICLAALLLTACSGSGDQLTVDDLEKSGKARVGIANERPYGYLNDAGEAEGLVIDILHGMLEPLGVSTIEPHAGSFDSTIPGLLTKKFDLIGAGTYITPERCESVAFTNPIYRVGAALIVKEGNPLDLHSLADIADHNTATVASQTGTSQVAEMESSGIPEARVQLFGTDQQAMSALRADRVDAVYFPLLQVNQLIEASGDDPVAKAEPFEQIPDENGDPTFSYGSIPIRQDDVELREALNGTLSDMRADGSLLEIYQQYGMTEEELPPEDVTAESRCNQ